MESACLSLVERWGPQATRESTSTAEALLNLNDPAPGHYVAERPKTVGVVVGVDVGDARVVVYYLYRGSRLEFMTYRGCQACLWEYSIGQTGTLDFFLEGKEYGHAILFEAPTATYELLVDSFKESILFEFLPDKSLT